MATVAHYQYDFLDSVGFAPGEVRIWRFGPFSWFRKAVVATAQPFSLSTQDRTLTTEINLQTTPNSPAGDEWVNVTVRNIGVDTIVIYYITLGVIAA
jgi:hypothetical protein